MEPVVARVLPRLARAVAPHIPPSVAITDLDARLQHLDARMEALRAAWDLPTPPALAEALATNQELFKAELHALRGALDDFGMAVAPAAGLDAAPARMGELRARLDVLDKRVRSLLERTSPIPDAEEVLPATFDYVGFEQRFRGDADVVLSRTEDRYFDLLADASPVLDVGCGRGEVLAALAERGVKGIGVDLDAGMVAEAQSAGVDARQGDALAFLADAEPESFGAVIAIQVAEHLSLDALLSLVELAFSRLRPGGALVLETPNPASLIVLGNSYLLDPTHVRPLHPSLLSFLVERAGFSDVRLEFYEPATGYHLDLLDEAEIPEAWAATVNDAFRRLNEVLFGPQDYAVIARR
jgi:SAM-dependent methyltransferase